MNSLSANYKVASDIIKKRPIKLWGIVLLEMVFSVIVSLTGFLPIIVIPINAVLSASMSAILLKSIRGEECETKNLFDGFRNFKHVAAGMCWQIFWISIWVLVPLFFLLKYMFEYIGDAWLALITSAVIGNYSDFSAPSIAVCIIFLIAILAASVVALIKSTTYIFTPYILMTRPEVSALDAIKESKRMTYGIKVKIFFANMIPAALYLALYWLIQVFARIPYISIIFVLLGYLLQIAWILFAPLFLGLVNASFYNNSLETNATAISGSVVKEISGVASVDVKTPDTNSAEPESADPATQA